MKKIIIKGLFIIVLVAGSYCAKAQFDPDGDADGDPDTPIPLDPGSWVLVAAGVGYGVKKWRDARQQNKEGGIESNRDFLPGNKTAGDDFK